MSDGKTCSVELNCEGGLWECQRQDLQSQLEKLGDDLEVEKQKSSVRGDSLLTSAALIAELQKENLILQKCQTDWTRFNLKLADRIKELESALEKIIAGPQIPIHESMNSKLALAQAVAEHGQNIARQALGKRG